MLMETNKKKKYASVRIDVKSVYGHLQQALINNVEFVNINCSQNSSDNLQAPDFSGGGLAVWVEDSKYA